jgi:hypothetical protein
MRIIKLILSLVLAFISGKVNAQSSLPIDEDTKLITYTKVVEVTGTSKTDLYNRGFAWANKFYKNPADVIREKDAVAGKMVCKARFKLMNEPDKSGLQTNAGDVMYTLTIDFKEGKFRYKLTDINWQQLSYYPAEKWMNKNDQKWVPVWDFYLKEVDDNVKKIIADLTKAVSEAPKVKKDDW